MHRLAGLLLAVATGCGSSAPPPPPGTGPSDGGQPAQRAPPSAWGSGPTCADLGKSACDCLQIDTVGPPSTVYFVLDRSAAVGLDAAWPRVVGLVERVSTQLGPRAAYGVTLFPDPGAIDACATGSEVFAVQRGDGPPGSVGPTTSALLAAVNVSTSGGAPLAATLDALASRLGSLGGSGRASVVLVTDGAPSCNSRLSCNAGGCIANLEGAQQCPTGGPPNCCDPTLAGPLECLDDVATVAAITRVTASGAPVYVVSTSTDATFDDLLGEMAHAGSPTFAGPIGLDDADESQLVDALAAGAGQLVSSCTFQLSAPPPDVALVSVALDGTAIAQGPDGWTLSGASVTLQGAACTAVTSAGVGRLRIAVACPGMPQ